MKSNGQSRSAAASWGIALACTACFATPFAAPLRARAAEVESHRVAAALSRDGSSVRGVVRARVRLGADERRIALWVFADRLAAAPTVDEISFRWVWPSEVDLGGTRVSEVRVDGRAAPHRWVASPATRAQAGRDVVVDLPAAGSERRVEIEVGFELRLPNRYGRLGRAQSDVVVLAAPWYPVVLRAPGAREPLAYTTHSVALSTFDGWTVIGPGGVGVHRVVASAPFVPFVAMREPVVRRSPRGATWVGVSRPDERPPVPPLGELTGSTALSPSELPDPFGIDHAGLTLSAADDALTTLEVLEVPTGHARGPVMVEVPMRAELVTAAPGLVLVSDAAFDVFPLEQLREFHARAVRQAVMRWATDALAARLDPPASRGISAEVRAAALVDLDYARRSARAQSVEDLVGFASFHPTIDQLLYAPQVQFPDVYFGSAGVRDPFRDDPDRARDGAPPGRYVLERLRDVLPERAFGRAARRLATGRGSMEHIVRAAGGDDAVAALREVVRRVPSLNYRLGALRSEPIGAGRWRHTIEVLRDGDRDVVEPVEVAVEDADGRTTTGRWTGRGARGVVTVESGAELEDVTIDPRGRLAQDPEAARSHPRYDDATSWPWRPPVFQSFQIALSPGDLGFDLLLDVVLRRRYELGRSIGITGTLGSAAATVAARHTWFFGSTADLNRMQGLFGISVDGARTFGEYSASSESSWIAGAGVFLGWDTRRYFFDMREGWSVLGSVRGALAFDDDGDRRPLAFASVRASRVTPIGWRHVLLLVGGGAATLGDGGGTELAGLSGRRGLRGYEAGELLGDASLYAVAEYRFTLAGGLAWNVAHLAWIRAIQLAAFGGAGLIFGDRGDRSLEGPLAFDAGGGLRIHFDYGGVQPGVLALDLAVPLSRQDACERGSDGECVRNRLPVGFWVSFDQFY